MDVTHGAGGGQAARWNGAGGQAWVAAQDLIDEFLRPYQDILVEAVSAGRPGRVLDVGCGTGGTTVAMAERLGADAECLGVDIADPMIAAARERAEREGSRASFLRADAQEHPFDPGFYDAVMSRFGVMFFDDPVRAFTNLRQAATSDAGLWFITWRGPAENPFMTTAEQAAAPLLPDLHRSRPDEPGRFAFADPDKVSHILRDSGWTGVDIQPLDVTCTMPESELVGYFTALGPVGLKWPHLDEQTRSLVVDTVRPAFDPFVRGPHVHVTSACWLVSASGSQGS